MWNPKEIGKLGGKSKSASKRRAARNNGAKGGRPPKEPLKDAPAKVWANYQIKLTRHRVVECMEQCLRDGGWNSSPFGFRQIQLGIGRTLDSEGYLWPYRHDGVFWPLTENEVRDELIRKGRRDLWLKYLATKPKRHTLVRKRKSETMPPLVKLVGRRNWQQVKPKQQTTRGNNK
jgi:hypothetical protein